MFRFLVNRGLADYRVLLLLFRACLTGDRVAYEEGARVLVKSTDGTGVATLMSTGGTRPVWDRVSGRVFTYGPITRSIWQGVNAPGMSSTSIPGLVAGMDVLPGGNVLLVAISEVEEVKDDSVRVVSVYLNAVKGLK